MLFLIFFQIEGVCEMENCSGQFAEFFFKCACHVTSGEDDSSSPLQQVKRNENFVPCLACAEAKDIALVFSCSSGHTACIDCFKQYANMKINQRDFIQVLAQARLIEIKFPICTIRLINL